MSYLISICGSSPVNQRVIIFDGPNVHFHDMVVDILIHNHLHNFFLKDRDYVNEQLNDIGPKASIKDL